MSETEAKVADKIMLVFIKNLSHNFMTVERFLKKRGYEIIVETDIKTGLSRVLELDPQYIFLAWDHKNENIRSLPKVIYQSSTGQIIPFIMSTARDQIIQLESSGFENKLYPPLSGPAIQRVISKYEKKSQALDLINRKKNEPAKKKSDLIKVKSFFTEDPQDDNEITMTGASLNDENHRVRGLSARHDDEAYSSQSSSAAGSEAYHIQTSKRMDNETRKAIAQNVRGKLHLFVPPEKKRTAAYVPKEQRSLTGGQIAYLDQSFTETIKPEMFDVIESYAETESHHETLQETTQIYTLIIQEPEWTGYLTVASENYLDIASAQVILNNWIKQMIRIERVDENEKPDDELPDALLFEMRIPKINFEDFCSYKADFYKEIIYEDKKTVLGFFSFSPYQVINSVHETEDLLELPTEFLQPETSLPFDVNLYLPENKKFILYLRPGAYLDKIQIDRLQNRNVDLVYSDMEYELAILKYKASVNIYALIKSYEKIIGSNP